jgi:hypothetical protein
MHLKIAKMGQAWWLTYLIPATGMTPYLGKKLKQIG